MATGVLVLVSVGRGVDEGIVVADGFGAWGAGVAEGARATRVGRGVALAPGTDRAVPGGVREAVGRGSCAPPAAPAETVPAAGDGAAVRGNAATVAATAAATRVATASGGGEAVLFCCVRPGTEQPASSRSASTAAIPNSLFTRTSSHTLREYGAVP